jgi:hypothetical protein
VQKLWQNRWITLSLTMYSMRVTSNGLPDVAEAPAPAGCNVWREHAATKYAEVSLGRRRVQENAPRDVLIRLAEFDCQIS